MACFDVWDIGACGCGGFCAFGQGMPLPGSITCCACIYDNRFVATPVVMTLDSPFCGQTTFNLNWNDSSSIPAWLTYSGSYAALSDCFTDGTDSYILCWLNQGSTWFPRLAHFGGSTSCGGAPSVSWNGTFQSASCLAGYQISVTSGPMHTAGVGQATITWTPGGMTCCVVLISVLGCDGIPIDDATINIWTDSTKTTLLHTATSNAIGPVELPVSATACGTYWVEVLAARFPDYEASTTVSYNGEPFDITLASPSVGYECTDLGCGYPLPTTLHATFTNAGPQTFTYAAGQWTASFTYLGIAYVINLATDGSMTLTMGGVSYCCFFNLNQCPVTPGFNGEIDPCTPAGTALGSAIITE
jgi:hypothetical protein